MLHHLAETCLRFYSRIAPTERGGLHLARLARRLRPRDRWRDTFRTPDGLELELDLATYPDVCMAWGLYELDTARLIKRLLRPGDHFVDSGANIGYFTLLAACAVGKHGRVDAFEPQPDNRARLIENLRRNHLDDRVAVHPQALGDRPGMVRVYRPADESRNHGQSSMFLPATVPSTAVDVPAVRMDEALSGARPKLVKLDVEGAEPLVIDGMRRLIEQSAPAIILEYNPPTSREAGFAPEEALTRLLRIRPDYRIRPIGFMSGEISLKELHRFGQCNLHLAVG
jgi:FkbM family methyltransferase